MFTVHMLDKWHNVTGKIMVTLLYEAKSVIYVFTYFVYFGSNVSFTQLHKTKIFYIFFNIFLYNRPH